MDLIKAAEEIGKLQRMFSALETLKPVLVEVASLQNAAEEAKKRIADANASLVVIQQESDRVQQAAAKDRAEAKAYVKDLTDHAKQTASEILAKAGVEAKQQAEAEAAKVAILRNERTAVATEVEAQRGVLADLTAKADQEAQRLAEIRKTIAALAKA